MLEAIRASDQKVVLVSMSGISGGDETKQAQVDFAISKPTTIDTLNEMI